MVIVHIVLAVISTILISFSVEDMDVKAKEVKIIKYKKLGIAYFIMCVIQILGRFSNLFPAFIGMVVAFLGMVLILINAFIIRCSIGMANYDIHGAYYKSEDELYKYKQELDRFNRGEVTEAEIADNPYKNKKNKFVVWVIRIYINTIKNLFAPAVNRLVAARVIALTALILVGFNAFMINIQGAKSDVTLPDELAGYQVNFSMRATDIMYRNDGGYQLHGSGKVTSNGKTYKLPAVIYIIYNNDPLEFDRVKKARKVLLKYEDDANRTAVFYLEGQAVFTGNKSVTAGTKTVMRPILEDNEYSTFTSEVKILTN